MRKNLIKIICELRNEAKKVKSRIKDEIKPNDQCCLCGKKAGDWCSIGPLIGVKRKIIFKTKISFHIIPSATEKIEYVKMCDECHFKYHFLDRYIEEDESGILY